MLESAPSLQVTGRSSRLPLEQDDRVEIECARCGYGAVVTSPPRRCPMCGGAAWRPAKRVHALGTLSEWA